VASRKAQAKVGELAAAVERAISSVRTVRAANATDREVAEVDVAAVGAWQMGIRVAKISALVVPVAGIAMQVAFLTVLGVGGYRVADGAITIASLVSFILFLFLMILPLGQAFGAISSVNAALGALGRIQEIIVLPSEGENDRDIAPLHSQSAEAGTLLKKSKNALTFQKVSFSYPLPVVTDDEQSEIDDALDADARAAARRPRRPRACAAPVRSSAERKAPKKASGEEAAAASASADCTSAAVGALTPFLGGLPAAAAAAVAAAGVDARMASRVASSTATRRCTSGLEVALRS
jgi:ATP-binding cassette subfamily B protein